LISGDSGAGKSTWCLEFLRQARLSGLAPLGLLSPPVYQNGRKVAIDLLAIASGERRRLAELRQADAREPGVSTENWHFDPAALNWGNRVLESIQSCDLLLIDELGPLELNRAEGLTSGLALIDQRGCRLACVVVRPTLLAAARQRWPWGEILEITANPAGEDLP